MDLDIYLDILKVDSTTGREGLLAQWIEQRLPRHGAELTRYPADAPEGEHVNLLLSWGDPQIVFCTHLDTVPPYIPPTVDDGVVRGRGACDAKGQIFSMYEACRRLAEEGNRGFGLLLLYGEETGSYGAKEYRQHPGGRVVIVGEPTDNKMVTASKGTKAFEVTIHGQPCHSGYPWQGDSAVERFVDLMLKLRQTRFPADPVLGPTTYNVGKLQSDNPQNILSPLLTCRIYFRTTFASDQMVVELMESMRSEQVEVKCLGGDTPMRYLTLPGFETTTVAFGSDAPQLTNFEQKILCGPGSILVAHRPEEYVELSELERAIDNYQRMYHLLK
ncbi:MAG: M20/M25/M40 family metallo-hydrolase [Bacteroidales bacterium]|nr:M20/M25/M40 family metallo-hydrolase [Bacteroidales bacterium]